MFTTIKNSIIIFIIFNTLYGKSRSLLNEHKRPNIVFILADDLGWGDVGLHGSNQIQTPNIDLLASNGIILNNYYVSPLCSPSRSALMTGYHPIHTGFQHSVIHNAQPWGLPLKFKILPQYLRPLGYETHIVGKWHLGFFKKDYLPTNRGFDSHFGFWSGHTDYYDRKSSHNGFDLRHNERHAMLPVYKDEYLTDILTNKSIDIIIRNSQTSEKPFFLYLAHNAVHAGLKKHSLQAPHKYVKRFHGVKNERRRIFCAMVSALDDSVGHIFAALHRTDALNNTIFIFSTDNGGATGGTGGWSIDNSIGSNWPLRGSKYTLFEGGIRGFSFIWSPLLKRQYESNHLMHIQDWLPTIYSAIGGHLKDLGPIDGIDMWSTLQDNTESRRESLLHNIDPVWKVWALRYGNYKLISGSTLGAQFNSWYLPPGEHFNTTSTNHTIGYEDSIVYRILHKMQFPVNDVQKTKINCNSMAKNQCSPAKEPCLFDIQSDPCEHHNIYDQKPHIVEIMLKQLKQFNSTAVTPRNHPLDEKSFPKYHNNWWSVWR